MTNQCIIDYAVEDLAEMIIDKLLDHKKFMDLWFELSDEEQEEVLFDIEDTVEEWMDIEEDETDEEEIK